MRRMIDITAVILGSLTAISTIGLGLFQYGLWKAQARESKAKAETTLIDAALRISEREVTVLRQVNEDLGKTVEKLEKDNESKEQYIERLRTRLRQFEDTKPLRQVKEENKNDDSKDEKGV